MNSGGIPLVEFGEVPIEENKRSEEVSIKNEGNSR